MSLLRNFSGACAAAMLLGCANAGGGFTPPLSSADAVNAMSSKYIKHVVIIVQENRTFDNFFAKFPGADGATSGYYLKKVGGAYKKTAITLKQQPLDGDLDINHNSVAYNYACDGQNTYPKTSCAMDGFNLEGIDGDNGYGPYPYMYIRQSDIQPYWDFAKQYALGDHLFQTQGSGSFTAHLDLIAGGTAIKPKVSPDSSLIDYPNNFTNWGCGAPKKPRTKTTLLTTAGQYLANKGPYPCLTYPTKTMRDLLDDKGVSWKYYTPPYVAGTTGALWNAFAVISAVYHGSEWGTNVSMPETNVFADITNNQLPAVSWVIPDSDNSDHPWGPNHVDNGPSWVASVVNAIGASPYWKSTAIVITWDDWGGFFDHEPPAFFDDAGGLGFRVPLIVVSPYVPKNEISHTQYEFASILKFVEQNFTLGSMHTTDARSKSIVDMFDFTQAPRPYKTVHAKFSARHFIVEPHTYEPMDDE